MITRITFILVFFVFPFSIAAQLPDTLVVYEYEYITDTIWIEQKPASRDTTPLAVLEAQNPKISFGLSATISENPIYDAVDHNQNNMKKTTFVTLLFLSFQNLSFAQPELNLKVGTTSYKMKPNTYVSSAIFLGHHCGLELKVPIKDSKMALSAGYEQHGYSNFDTNYDYPIHYTDYNSADTRIDTYRSIPILFYYQYLAFDFFAGYEYKMVLLTESTHFPSVSWNEHALVTGLDTDLGRKFSFSCKVYFGGLFNNSPVLTNRILTRTNVGFSLKYNLFWKSKYQTTAE